MTAPYAKVIPIGIGANVWTDDESPAPDAEPNGSPYSRYRDDERAQDEREREAVRDAQWSEVVLPVDPAWANTAPPKRNWLLRDKRTDSCAGVLPLGKAGQIIGEGGGSKTMAMFQLAAAVATGTDWLGTFSVASPGRVLLVLGEEDREEVQRRIYAVARGLLVPLKADQIVTLPLAGRPCALLERGQRGNTVETSFLRWLRAFIAESEWRLIVLDPLSRFAGPDAEKDNASATRFVQVVESLTTASGATTLTTHHTNQPSRAQGARLDGTSGRGSTALVDGFRWSAGLKVHISDVAGEEVRVHLRKTVELAHHKSNYSQEFEPVLLRRDPDNGVLRLLDEEDARYVAESTAGDAKRAAKASERATRDQVERERVDAIAMQIVREQPGIGKTKFCEDIRGAAHVGEDKAKVAIARVRGALHVEALPNKQERFWPQKETPST